MSSDDPPSEVNENYPDFDYNRLQCPPEEWELYDIPDKTHLRNRALDLDTFKKLVKHHTWGFHVVIGERRTKERLLQVLKRIIFNQAPNLRPSWHDFISRNCDAGPRLLRRSYNALQISRNYPNGLPGASIYLPPLPTQHQPQMGMLPSIPSGPLVHMPNQFVPMRAPNYPVLAHGGSNIPPSRQMEFIPAPISDQNQGLEPANLRQFYPQTYTTPQPLAHTFMTPSQSANQPHQPVPSIAQSSPSRNQTMSAASWRSMREPVSVLSTPMAHEVIEVIERAIMGFAYRQLQRHPDSLPVTRPAQSLVASTGAHLTLSTSRSYSTVSHARAVVVGDMAGLRFDPNGCWYPYRGRGPVSSQDTTAVDCAIVVGRLLDAGSTVADRESDINWTSHLSGLENAFLNALNVNWDVLSDTDSVIRREEFRGILLNWFSDKGLSIIPANVWGACTESFKQFHTRYTEQLYPCPCQQATTSSVVQTVTLLAPDFHENDATGVELADLLTRTFQCQQRFQCPQCGTMGANRIERRFNELPWRLAVRPDQRTLLQSHSLRNMTFNYIDGNGSQQQATYRWLGGIYCVLVGREYHFRVYWNDHERGEAETGNIRVYDGTQLSGAIIGGLRASGSQRVPHTWWVGGTPPVIFYEKVVNPEPEVLHAARGAVQGMGDTASRGRLILQHHRGWKPHEHALKGVQSHNTQGTGQERRVTGGRVSRSGFYDQSPSNRPRLQQLQSPLSTGASGERALSFHHPAAYPQRIASAARQTLPQPQVSGHGQRVARMTPQVQPGSRTGAPGFPSNTSCLVPAQRGKYISQENVTLMQNPQQPNLTPGIMSSGGEPPVPCCPSLPEIDFSMGFGPEVSIPELPPSTGPPLVPLGGMEIRPDPMLQNPRTVGPSAATTTEGVPQGMVGAASDVGFDMTMDGRQNTLPSRSRISEDSWASNLEEFLQGQDNSNQHVSCAFFDNLGALRAPDPRATTQLNPEVNPPLQSPFEPAQSQQQLQIGPTGLSTSPLVNHPPAGAGEIDDPEAWAFDFDGASVELPNPVPGATAPATVSAIETAPTAGMSVVNTGSNVLGHMLQDFVGHHEPQLGGADIGMAGQAQGQQGTSTGYYSETMQPSDAPMIGNDGGGTSGEKRKREECPEDGQQSMKKLRQ
ncbi:hypothetical protein D8B26_000636 [Coccidioides posadasii str. Silveira]|uniref:uncharacterized protein n=1 Tax=Coccidioides posadasii (strain RMSCC 757 / Silveira) TaxID=443226 RepID=UPI001BF06703|nr:hypothetical protein D8B26_000636 [Coccidioides posadasii str. Silveira]